MRGEEDKNPVGRPAKRDFSWLKLRKYDGDSDVEEWIGEAEECVKLLKLTRRMQPHLYYTL